MSIATYDDLVAAVGNWLVRSDLAARIPEFIALAEAKFNRQLELRQQEQRSTTTISTTSTAPEFITLPADFNSMRRVCLSSVTGKPALEFLAPTALYDMRINHFGDDTGQPEFFTIIGSEMELLPIPDDNYTIEMVYRKNIPALSATNEQNWLLTLAPDVYLYGALREAAVFMQNDERIPMWNAAYVSAIQELADLNIAAAYNASPITMRVSGMTP